MRTVSFKTFGCRLNHAESAQFEAEFTAAGFARVPFGTPAEVIVVHSCAVTQKAENECLKMLRTLRKNDPRACLVLTGCAVEACSDAQRSALPVDVMVPRDQKSGLVPLVLRHLGVQSVMQPVTPACSTKRAALKIQDGCDFFCAYCIVPHTRGAPNSRPFDDCLADAQQMLLAGFHEIVVTGCNIACYSHGPHTLVDLVSALLALPGLGRLRLGSIEPGTIERTVIELMAQSPKLCPFLHLPVQSGDNGVLARMRRRYTVEAVTETLRDALSRMPHVGLGADVICGFPGETAEAFERTRAWIETSPFSKLHVFPYSERPGTPAATFEGRVPVTERKRRTQVLIEIAANKRSAFAKQFVGCSTEFLVERFDKDGRAHGWSGEYLACSVSGVPRDRLRTLCTFTPDGVKDDELCGRWRGVTAAETAQPD